MKKSCTIACLVLFCNFSLLAQDTNWTVKNKQYLVDNYLRTQQEVNNETKGLSIAQWNFKETDTSWSIAMVVEHMNMWSFVTQEHIRYMGYNGPQPNLVSKMLTDSAATNFIHEEKKHVSPDFTVPTGMIPDKANLKVFNVYYDRIIDNIRKADINLKLFFRTFTGGYMTNMNQAYILHFGHIDRHLKQVRRIKGNAKFPKL